jgi:hypothetical protein
MSPRIFKNWWDRFITHIDILTAICVRLREYGETDNLKLVICPACPLHVALKLLQRKLRCLKLWKCCIINYNYCASNKRNAWNKTKLFDPLTFFQGWWIFFSACTSKLQDERLWNCLRHTNSYSIYQRILQWSHQTVRGWPLMIFAFPLRANQNRLACRSRSVCQRFTVTALLCSLQ